MRYLIHCLAAAALVIPAAGAPNAGDSPPRGKIVPANYVFVPGDVLEVTVTSHTGYDRTITIQPDGRIQFPVAGELVAAGLTSTELAARLQEGMRRELIDPQVTVSLKELNRGLLRRVSVFGAVKTPGTYELKERSTLAEILATAGGPTPIADLSHIRITHTDGGQQVVSLAHVARTGDLGNNALLQPGDLVLVPEGAPSTVLVLGQVLKPGSYELQGEMRVMDALSQAGGPTPQADLAHVRLTREGQVQVADLRSLASGTQASPSPAGTAPDLAANLSLRPGDTIVVPESDNQVYVLGDVTKPDAYRLRAGDRVFDVLTRAGGPGSKADTHKAVLMRRDEHGQPAAQHLDLARMLQKGDMRQNMALQPGDVILIPSKGSHSGPLSSLTETLLPFATLLRVFAGW
jgi:polysaccharide biosynthesis/export protein